MYSILYTHYIYTTYIYKYRSSIHYKILFIHYIYIHTHIPRYHHNTIVWIPCFSPMRKPGKPKTPLKIKSLQPPPGHGGHGCATAVRLRRSSCVSGWDVELSQFAIVLCWVYISTYGGIITLVVYVYIYICTNNY